MSSVKERKKWVSYSVAVSVLGIFSIILLTCLLYFFNDSIKESLNRMFYSQRWKFLFDQEFYYFIGQYGYSSEMDYAFFPLMPQIISMFKGGSLDYWGAILVNNTLKIISGCLILLCLSRYQKLSKPFIALSLVFWICSPIGLFTSILYSESLFVFCTIFSFYLLYHKKCYFFGGVFAGLSALARPIGFVWCATIGIQQFLCYLSQRQHFKWKSTLKCFLPMTIIALSYPVYLYMKTGDLLKFVTVQYEKWNKAVGLFFQGFWYDFTRFQEYPLEAKLMFVFALIATIIVFVVGWKLWGIRHEQDSFVCLIYLSLAFLFITNSAYKVIPLQAATSSQFRYLFSLFPIYLVVPRLPKLMRVFVISIGVCLYGLTIYFFLLERYLC